MMSAPRAVLVLTLAIAVLSPGCEDFEQAQPASKTLHLSTRRNLPMPAAAVECEPPALPGLCDSEQSLFHWRLVPVDVEGDAVEINPEASHTITIPQTCTDDDTPILLDAGACIHEATLSSPDAGEWVFHSFHGNSLNSQCAGVVTELGEVDDFTRTWVGFTIDVDGCEFDPELPEGTSGEHPE